MDKTNIHYNTKKWEYDSEGRRGLTCCKCKVFKLEDNYCRLSGSGLGVKYKCRACSKIDKDRWGKTKEGVIQTIWDSQKLSCKLRKMEQPKYTKDWFFDWCLSQEIFHTLFEAWEKSGYTKHLKPSVDRINNFETYLETNIRLMTWEENNLLGNLALKEGTSTFNYVGVSQYTLDGVFIKDFLNTREAERELGITYQNIHGTCKGRRNQAGGFVWKFTTK